MNQLSGTTFIINHLITCIQSVCGNYKTMPLNKCLE